MTNKPDRFEDLLKQAFQEDRVLNEDLIETTKDKIQGQNIRPMKTAKRKQPLRWVASIAAGLLLTSVTAYAAIQMLTPSDVVNEFGDGRLAVAFESENAIPINESQTSEGYIFTLMSIVSGEDLTDTPLSMDGELQNDRSYLVLAIEREDGTPMTESTSTFFSSPYVRGMAPWHFNIATGAGGHQETIIDGTLYRLIDMENVEIFANQGVYFGISLGNFSFEAFDFDRESGVITLNPDFNGFAVLFELPLDPALADEARVEEMLANLSTLINDEDACSIGLDFTSEFDGQTPEERGMTFARMTYDEVADFLEARIERDIENGEPQTVIQGARRDREDTLRRMREYDIAFAEVWYDDEAMAISLDFCRR